MSPTIRPNDKVVPLRVSSSFSTSWTWLILHLRLNMGLLLGSHHLLEYPAYLNHHAQHKAPEFLVGISDTCLENNYALHGVQWIQNHSNSYYK